MNEIRHVSRVLGVYWLSWGSPFALDDVIYMYLNGFVELQLGYVTSFLETGPTVRPIYRLVDPCINNIYYFMIIIRVI